VVSPLWNLGPSTKLRRVTVRRISTQFWRARWQNSIYHLRRGSDYSHWRSAGCGRTTCRVQPRSATLMTSTVLFENERIRITDFRLPPGAKGGNVQHDYPTLRWQVGQGCHRPIGSDGQIAEPVEVADKSVFWMAQGEPWLCVNAHADEFRQICWAFKKRPRHTEAHVRSLLESAIYSTNVGTALLFENEYCRVWDFYLHPNGGDMGDIHHHVLDYAFVYVAPGRLLGSFHDGTPGLFDSVNADGDVTWTDIPDSAPSDPNYAHGGKNGYSDRAMREYLVELK
jgi:hypothetical protein